MKKNVITNIILAALGLFLLPFAYAGIPLWTFTPLTETAISISPNGTGTVSYTITNQSRKPHTLVMRAIPGITQVTDLGNCSTPFTLAYHQSCTLQLHLEGNALAGNVVGGPEVCQANTDGVPNPNQCYQPSQASALQITKTAVTLFSVGGHVSGLTSSGLVLRQNDSGDVLPISTNGSFTFPSPVASGTPYEVIVQAQPANQICTVTNGSAIMGNANVTNIIVTCASGVQTVGGTVNGLTDTLVLLLNGANSLTMTSDGNFTFATPLPSGSPYAVTIQSQPSGQLCTVNNGTGIIADENVTNVAVHCSTNTRTIGGTISGLTGTVVLQNNGGDNYTTNANGSFTFATALAQGSTYDVTVLTEPAGQICTVSHGTGTVGSINVITVLVTCNANAFTVGGSVMGLIGTITLQNNDGDTFSVSAPASSYTFPTPVAQGAPYNVTVSEQPTGQTCTVANSSGVMGGANVTHANVTCTTNTTTLSTSVSSLALSITGLTEYGVQTPAPLSGHARMITITNTGSNAATNLAVTIQASLPTGTNVTNDTCNGSSLAPGGSCVITIQPGAVATSDGTGPCLRTAPEPAAVEVKADNSAPVTTDVVVLNYQCIYQGGYVYAFDDIQNCPTEPCTVSVGGKVAISKGSVVWSTTKDVIYGISEKSTLNDPDPSDNDVTGQNPCNGAIDGACNTNNIIVYYDKEGINHASYAAGQCNALRIDNKYENWYLAASCELQSGEAAGCGIQTAPRLQNIKSNLSIIPVGGWSSTETNMDPKNRVWVGFLNDFGSFDKGSARHFACSRVF